VLPPRHLSHASSHAGKVWRCESRTLPHPSRRWSVCRSSPVEDAPGTAGNGQQLARPQCPRACIASPAL